MITTNFGVAQRTKGYTNGDDRSDLVVAASFVLFYSIAYPVYTLVAIIN